MSDKATIPAQLAEDLMWSGDGAEFDGWTRVAQQEGAKHRWYRKMLLILRAADGNHWALPYEQGLTELQETEWPWDQTKGGSVELVRVYPHEVVSTVYRYEPPS